MIDGARYSQSKTVIHRQALTKFMELRDKLLGYNSAYEFADDIATATQLIIN